MKFKGQGKKEYIVMMFDDYLNEWVDWSKPVTIGQANWLLSKRPFAKFKIEKLTKDSK